MDRSGDRVALDLRRLSVGRADEVRVAHEDRAVNRVAPAHSVGEELLLRIPKKVLVTVDIGKRDVPVDGYVAPDVIGPAESRVAQRCQVSVAVDGHRSTDG